jgi:hypothetical protein
MPFLPLTPPLSPKRRGWLFWENEGKGKEEINMKKIIHSLFSLFMFFLLGGGGLWAANFSEVEKILDVPGKMQEGVVVFPFPRSDLRVKINGEPVPTALGFGSWTAWKEMGTEVMVMGDLVLLQKEVNPVITALAEAKIEVTALHNHFLGENPRIMYMHISAMGPAPALARGIRNALNETATPRTRPASAVSAPALKIDTKRLEQIVGHSGQMGGGVFKIIIGRPGVKMGEVELTASMGLNTWAAFAGTDERAQVAGDVAMTAKEVNPVIRALRRGGIDVLAVHNHMLDEQPRIFFLHYWGTGPAEQLAKAIRAAFDEAKGPVQ